MTHSQRRVSTLHAASGVYQEKENLCDRHPKEDPHVIIFNASGVAGAAQVRSDKLTALGMTVDAIGNAPAGMTVTTNTIYHVGKTTETKTAEKLSALYGATPKVATSVPNVTVGDSTDYVIILVKANTSATGNTTAQ